MREIKFRAWHKSLQCFLGKEYSWTHYGPCIVDGALWSDLCVIEQYTGLKDKNGKEIYEGDIIHSLYPDNNRVYYDDETAMFGYRHGSPYGTTFSALFRHLSDVEVIGNIHENLELLEADK